MSVSGIVITIAENTTDSRGVLTALEAEPQLQLGEPLQDRIPAVIDAPDASTAHAVVDRLRTLPGILAVDVIFVGTEDAPADPQRPSGPTPPDRPPFSDRRLS